MKKRRTEKKVLSAVLAATMVMSMTACGQGGSQNQKTADTAAETEAAEKTLTASGLDAQYFDEEGNMKLPLTDGSYTFKILWKKSADDKGTPADKYMLQEALKATGIKVEVEEVAAQAWDEKISVIFASGDLPDAICGEMPNLINFTDQCTDLTDLFPQYCPFINSFFEENPGSRAVNEFDGRLYSLSHTRINMMNCDTLWSINTTWLKNVGMDIPTTTDELYEVLKAFKEQDANGNGDPNDEIPYSFNKVNDSSIASDGLLSLMNMFGMVNDGAARNSQYIMVEDGKVKFAPTEERFYEMLKYINKLYSEGLIDQDGLLQEPTDRYSKGSSDRLGFFTHGGLATGVVGNEIGEQYEYIAPPASEYGSYCLQLIPAAEMSGPCFVITNQCKYPELMLMLCEYMNSTPDFRFYSRFGPEGAAWVLNEEGKAANASDFEGKPYKNRNQATATTGMGFCFPVICTEEEENRRAYVGFSIPYNEAVRNLYGPNGGHAWAESFPLGNDTLESSARRSELFAEIDTYIQNFVAESMTTGIDDAKWQAHLGKCGQLGVDEYVDNFQTLYEKLK